MVTYTFPNGTNIDDAIVSFSSSVPIFPIMILVFVWVVMFFSGVQRQNKRFGYSDLPQWAALSSMATLLLSLVMTMKEGIIALPVLIIVISITVLSAIWFFWSRGRFE